MAPRVAAALLLVALVGGCGGAKPHFRQAAGWHLLSRDGELVAANVPPAAADRSLASPPSHTVASLPRYGIVIWLLVVKRGHTDVVDANFPRAPLRVDQTVATNPPEGFGCPPAARSDCFAEGGSIRRMQASAADWDIAVTIFFGTDRPLPEDVAAADAELARFHVPGTRTTSTTAKAADCPRPSGTAYYDSTVRPSSGPPGSTVTVTGRLPVVSESGRDVGQSSTEVTAYWNLDLDHWTSFAPAVAGRPVKLVGTQNVADRCTYRVPVKIPTAPPGTYPLEVLYGDVHGSASFRPANFRVTSG